MSELKKIEVLYDDSTSDESTSSGSILNENLIKKEKQLKSMSMLNYTFLS